MKKLLLFTIAAFVMSSTYAQTKYKSAHVEKGIVKGRVTDANGIPIPNCKVVIENTLFYASYVYAVTNAEGEYKTKVPNGSWKASVVIERSFSGKNYRFDLHPDNADPFAGTAGAVRNFTWKLRGQKPGINSYYGSHVAVYSEPGSSFMMHDVELTLTPYGVLADGNKGDTIVKSLADIGGGEDGINDVPIGSYVITARNKSNGKTLQVRLRNKGVYSNSLHAWFESGFTGLTTYQIVIQVRDKDDF